MDIIEAAAVAGYRFPIWRTLTLGAYESANAYQRALRAEGCRVSDFARGVLSRVQCAQSACDVDLVVGSVSDLGLEDYTDYRSICARVVELGFGLAPAEVGPALRLAYRDQPKGEHLHVAMEPVTNDDIAFPTIFDLHHAPDF